MYDTYNTLNAITKLISNLKFYINFKITVHHKSFILLTFKLKKPLTIGNVRILLF